MSEIFEFLKTAFSIAGICFILILIIGLAIQNYEDRKK
jgi:hypothetical protein